MPVLRLRCSETEYPARAIFLDSSLRWNDEHDTPVIPGEQRETRNPGNEGFVVKNTDVI